MFYNIFIHVREFLPTVIPTIWNYKIPKTGILELYEMTVVHRKSKSNFYFDRIKI